MKFLLFSAFFFLLMIPLVLGVIIPTIRSHRKTTGKTVNYDAMMRVFMYRIQMSEEAIINTLKAKSSIDELSCEFDFERSIVKISEYGSSRDYYYTIQTYDVYSVLKLTQVSLIGMQSHIPYKLNPFMVKKLNAELVPYKE